MPAFLQRLKQRKLVQWALAYLAAAFVLLQGLDIIGQQFGWPEGARRGITLALAVGFFVSLLLAWYHGERGVQRVSGTELLIIALLLALGGGFLWYFARTPPAVVTLSRATSRASVASSTKPSVQPVSKAMAPPTPIAAIPTKSIAVLPFVNDSGDPKQRYFSDGLSEDLIIALSQYPALTVIGRESSFQMRDTGLDTRGIGEKLGVAHLLEGSVSREGGEVRIRAELVNTADGSTLWSQHYDRPYKNLFALQDDITGAVATALKAKLLAAANGAALVQSERPPGGSLAAYNAYLQGNFYYDRTNEKSLHQAVGFYQQAIALDPKYAAAYAALAHAWARLGSGGILKESAMRQAYAEARAAADQALALDPDLAIVHEARGYVLFFTLNWREAEAEFRRGLALAPGNAQAMRELALALSTLGRLDEAVQLQRESLAVNPLDDAGYYDLALYLSGLDQPEPALQAMRQAISLQPTDAGLHAVLAAIEIQRGDSRAALQAAEAEQAPIWRPYALALAYTAAGDQARADTALRELTDRYADDAAYRIARIYAFRDQPDEAFVWLDRAWRQRDSYIRDLLYDPFLLRYKHDSRFAAFCKKIGLPPPGPVLPDVPSAPAAPASGVPSATRTP